MWESALQRAVSYASARDDRLIWALALESMAHWMTVADLGELRVT